MTILLLLSYVFAGTCELSNAKDGKVDVYYQRVQTSGTVPTTSVSQEITMVTTVDAGVVKVDRGLKMNRPYEVALVTASILLDDEIVGDLKFEITAQVGRISGEPVVSYDRATRIVSVTANLKYIDGKYDRHNVSLSGRVINTFEAPVVEPVLLEPKFTYVAQINHAKGSLEPAREGKNGISVLNRPVKILIKDATGCIWYQGNVNEDISADNAVLFQGTPLYIVPEIRDSALHLSFEN